MLESKIEKYLSDEIAKLGGWCEKHTCPGTRGVPDRIVMWQKKMVRHGYVDVWHVPYAEFIETKAPDGRLSKLQKRDHERRRDMGFKVWVIWDMELAETYLALRGKK